MTTTAQILLAARALIEPPGSWCRGSEARDVAGSEVDALDDQASSFCALGALERAASNLRADYRGALDVLIIIHPRIDMFNDDPATTHADVLAAFDAAIEKARADG